MASPAAAPAAFTILSLAPAPPPSAGAPAPGLDLAGLDASLPDEEELAAKGERALERLRAYVQHCGGELPAGWSAAVRCRLTSRRNGRLGRTTDNFYFSPCGATLRTHRAVAELLGLPEPASPPPARRGAGAAPSGSGSGGAAAAERAAAEAPARPATQEEQQPQPQASMPPPPPQEPVRRTKAMLVAKYGAGRDRPARQQPQQQQQRQQAGGSDHGGPCTSGESSGGRAAAAPAAGAGSKRAAAGAPPAAKRGRKRQARQREPEGPKPFRPKQQPEWRSKLRLLASQLAGAAANGTTSSDAADGSAATALPES
ncbi:hypothetical protein HT031_004058 [Scenedesmus sp. PABB004]|nr:hypothetical protein HT031_004058 [Scenedesmus sp. PABB004]